MRVFIKSTNHELVTVSEHEFLCLNNHIAGNFRWGGGGGGG